MVFKEGYSNFISHTHEWKTQFDIKDLSQLPSLPDFLPPGVWKGSMTGQILIRKQGPSVPFVGVSISTSPIEGQVQIKNEFWEVSGLVKTQFQTSFNYNEQFKLDNLIGYLDLTSTQVRWRQWLAKPSMVPLKAEVDIQFKQGLLVVKKMDALFHKLKSTIAGTLSQNKSNSSNLQISIPETQLIGFEQYIPALNKSPMKGSVGLKALIQGHIGKLNGLKLRVDNLNINNIDAFVDYQTRDKDFNVKGPVQLTSQGSLILENMKISKANLTLNAIGDKLDFKVANKLSKKAGGPLRLSANLQQQNNKMTLKQTLFKAPGLDADIHGIITNDQLTHFDLIAKLNNFDKAELEKIFPVLANSEIQPIARGNLRIKGRLDPQIELAQLPFEISGGLFVKLPMYKIIRRPANASGEMPIEGESLMPPKALLPDWPMFKKADLQV
ncbi:MAG: hypothetical protein KDD40_12260, partial [Bdellovibrionales bacterium]|nr:hypothetical protein [Bdellovibrionales bacterium]